MATTRPLAFSSRSVYENYHGRGSVTYASNGFSSTKSSCAALYGIAMEQGWADPSDKVADKNSKTRQCNDDATFQNVLTMTGRSSNLDNPRFSYDTFGTSCLDALHDFIGENNPDGLSTEAWKDKYWHDALGMENHRWNMPANNGILNMVCGSDQQITCRDMARNAQLYLNNGVWEGEQLMSEQFAKDSRIVTVDGGEQYGYTLWLNSRDPVDPLISSFEGMNGQSAYISTMHDAIVVTMGTDSGGQPAWDETRDAIVSEQFRPIFRQGRAKLGPAEDADNAAFPYEFAV